MPLLRELDSACCGCSVRGVTRFLFYIGIIFGVLHILTNASQPEPTREERENLVKAFQETFGWDEKQAARNVEEFYQVSRKVHIAMVVDMFINVVCCCLGLYGSYKGKGGFFVPYLVLGGIGLISFVVLVVLCVIAGFFFPILFLLAILLLIAFAFSYYLYLIVWSHYKEIKNAEHVPGTMKYSV